MISQKYKYFKVKSFEANGGPVNADLKRQATPTRQGRYVVGVIEKHRSKSRWPLSMIAWGTPLRLYQNKIQIEQNGVWNNLSSFSDYYTKYKKNEDELVDLIVNEYESYKRGLKNLLTPNELNKKIPDIWMFNDFGHIAIKYYNDINGNYRRDKGESFVSDFIHTVPNEEYRNSMGIAPMILPESHGCIHLHPKDIDFVITTYLKGGSVVEIHDYSDTYAPISMERFFGKPPFEAHFFPGLKKLFIYKVSKV